MLLGLTLTSTQLLAQALELLTRYFIVSSEEVGQYPVIVVATKELLRRRQFERLFTLNKVRIIDIFPRLVDVLLVVIAFASWHVRRPYLFFVQLVPLKVY